MNVSDDGFVRLEPFVVLIAFAPVEPAVYVKVPAVFPVVMLTLVGVNVPPPLESLGVIVTVEVAAELSVTVKLVEATDGRPALGPVSV